MNSRANRSIHRAEGPYLEMVPISNGGAPNSNGGAPISNVGVGGGCPGSSGDLSESVLPVSSSPRAEGGVESVTRLPSCSRIGIYRGSRCRSRGPWEDQEISIYRRVRGGVGHYGRSCRILPECGRKFRRDPARMWENG